MTHAQISLGHVTPAEAYGRLAEAKSAQVKSALVDVRTRAEWIYVGVPDLSGLADEPLFVEWQQFPSMTVDPAFPATLAGKLAERNHTLESHVFFLCRSGVRSLAAARAMAAMGYRQCWNIAGGFEGPQDEHGHRGRLEGWKAAGLPWIQS